MTGFQKSSWIIHGGPYDPKVTTSGSPGVGPYTDVTDPEFPYLSSNPVEFAKYAVIGNNYDYYPPAIVGCFERTICIPY